MNINALLAISAGATFLLALAAFWAIWQNHQIQKRERKERLLNEIIEWAEDVARWNFKSFNFIEAQISEESWVESSLGEIVSQFQAVEAKGAYINTIVLSSFKGKRKLLTAVKAVNKEIRKFADVSMKRLDNEVTPEEVTKHMNLLRLKIAGLLKETAEIKSKDIGYL